MTNVLTITAEDSDALLNAGAYGAGALIRLQTAATELGAYADVTGTGSTPTIPLVAGIRLYSGFDPSGILTSWYRTRYENAGATRLSDWSASFQVGTGVTQLCSAGQVKSRLFPAGAASDTSDDGLINELVDQVSDWISRYTGRTFTPEVARTYVFDTEFGEVLHIARGVRAITSMGVAWTSQPDSGGSYTAVVAGDILLRPKTADGPAGWPYTSVRISRAHTGAVSRFATVQNGCTITGAFGFASVPADINGVAVDAVVAAYQSRRNGASSVLGAEADAIVPWSSFFGRGSPQRGTLDRYREFPV